MTGSSQVWKNVIPFDDLPQLLNPQGGYLHNEKKFSLEDVVEMKHSMKMVLADQVKGDLLRIARHSGSGEELTKAIEQFEKWDNSVASDSKGGVLFESWFMEYMSMKWARQNCFQNPGPITTQ